MKFNVIYSTFKTFLFCSRFCVYNVFILISTSFTSISIESKNDSQ